MLTCPFGLTFNPTNASLAESSVNPDLKKSPFKLGSLAHASGDGGFSTQVSVGDESSVTKANNQTLLTSSMASWRALHILTQSPGKCEYRNCSGVADQ